jgi:hypothetical protein
VQDADQNIEAALRGWGFVEVEVVEGREVLPVANVYVGDGEEREVAIATAPGSVGAPLEVEVRVRRRSSSALRRGVDGMVVFDVVFWGQ